MNEVRIQKGGKLIEFDWNGDKQKYIKKDITKLAIAFLFNPCSFEKGSTLRDVFLLLDTNLKMFHVILGNWCDTVVKEGLKPLPKNYKETEIEYIELSYNKQLEVENKVKKLDGMGFPELHGIGFVQKTNRYALKSQGAYLECKAGKRMSFSIALSPPNELSLLPIKLNKTFKIFNDFKCIEKYEDNQFTLGQILYGIFWELTFYGPPKKSSKVREDLIKTAAKIRSGKTNFK